MKGKIINISIMLMLIFTSLPVIAAYNSEVSTDDVNQIDEDSSRGITYLAFAIGRIEIEKHDLH